MAQKDYEGTDKELTKLKIQNRILRGDLEALALRVAKMREEFDFLERIRIAQNVRRRNETD